MSTFYQSLPYNIARSFKKRKQRFKKGKPCVVCGKRYAPDEMMVAHKRPVSELTDREALYDEKNWEVRCIYCEQRLNRQSDIMKKKGGNHGQSQELESRSEKEEILGTVCQDGGEQEAQSSEDESRESELAGEKTMIELTEDLVTEAMRRAKEDQEKIIKKAEAINE